MATDRASKISSYGWYCEFSKNGTFTNPWKLNQFTMESQNGFDFNWTSIQPKISQDAVFGDPLRQIRALLKNNFNEQATSLI